METEILKACDRLVTAAMNGVCQGILLAALVALGIRLAGRMNAATRHAIWFFTLILLAGLIPANCLRDCLFQSKERSAATASDPLALVSSDADETGGAALIGEAAENSIRAPLDTDFADRNVPALINGGPASDEYPFRAESEFANNASTAVVPDSTEVPRKPRNHEPQASIVVLPDGASRLDGPPSATRPQSGPGNDNELVKTGDSSQPAGFWSQAERWLSPVSWNLNSTARIPWFISLVLLAFWLSVAGAHTLLLLCHLGQIRKLKAKSFPPNAALDLCFRELCHELAVSRKVKLKLSYAQRSPMVLGFVHPVILLPAEPGKAMDRTEAGHILRHELAHVCRRDDWVNLAQHLIQATLFFHPGVWWISRRLGLEREFACDDYVLELGGSPRSYALLLADLASRLNRRNLLLAPGISTNKSQLQQRINMILNTRRNASPRLAKTRLGLITSAAAALAVLGIYATPRVILAQVQPARAAATPAPPAVLPTAVTLPAPHILAAPDAVAADAAPVAAGAPGADFGPRFKPESNQDTPRPELAPVAPRPVTTPATPLPPRVGFAPFVSPVPYVAANDLPGEPGAQPRRPRAHEGGSSIEERLARLEEMVHSLMAQQHGAHMSADIVARKHAEHEEMIDHKEIERIHQLAERQAARAADQAKIAAEQIERGMRDQQGRRGHGKHKEMWGKQIESLRTQREVLERQMEHLERQIEKLEQEQEKLSEQEESQSEEKVSEDNQEEKQSEDKQNEDKQDGGCASKTVEVPAKE